MVNLGVELLASNVGVTFENIVLMLVLFGGLVFYAKDFKLGLVLQFVIVGAMFMWFYEQGYNWVFALIVWLITLVLIAFSLYPISAVSEGGVA